MPILSVRQGVEVFHLGFLGELGTKLDRGLYAVKGGCNLRFFFHSIRYSEDLDIDVETVGVDTLRQKVTRLLSSPSLTRTLGAHGVVVEASSRPKQTDTTQRWKVSLTVGGAAAHTKVEFSRRGLGEGIEFGVVDPALTSEYGLTRTLASHYGRQAAAEQKVRALVGRTETQARDVFDLDLLLSGAAHVDLSALPDDTRRSAQELAMSVDFDSFQGQVLAFLPPERQAQYDASELWEDLVLRVVRSLEGADEAD